jgi:hypothetical protein
MGIEPEALKNRPVLDARQAYYYNAYQVIARGRQVSMGGPLPLDAVSGVLKYCELFHITQIDERDRLLRHLICLDNAYLEHVDSQRKDNSAK